MIGSEARSSELVSQSAKLLKQIGPVMEHMGDMLSAVDFSDDEEQNEDTGTYVARYICS